MKLTRIEQTPPGYEYYTSEEFGEYDLKELEKAGVEEGAYWYASAPYEGTGHIIYRIGSQWHHHDCGHCSCYGPVDEIRYSGGFDSVDELISHCSEELKAQVQCLTDVLTGKVPTP